MTVITLAQVKEQLGITTSTYDAAINAKLPIIDAKVKLTCNNNFNFRFAADTTNGSSTMTAYSLYHVPDQYPSGIMNPTIVKDVTKELTIGMQLSGTGIASGAYITNFYKSGSTEVNGMLIDVVYVEMSAAATADGSGVVVTGGISIAYLDVIAHGVQYLLNQTSTSMPEAGAYVSKTMGPLSITKGDSKIDGKTGMPMWFVRGLPRYI